MIQLHVNPSEITQIIGFNGNIDVDSILPAVNIAQNIHIKRILGSKLYDKMQIMPLTGDYLTIRNDYLKFILAFYSASIYLSLNTIKTTNNGSYKVAGGEGDQSASHIDLNLLSKNYESIALSYEKSFVEFMKTVNVLEYDTTAKPLTRMINLY